MIFKYLLLVLLSLSAMGSRYASADQVDDWVAEEMAKSLVPGLAFAVISQGEVLDMRAYGLANMETGSPVKTLSVFELASLTKPITTRWARVRPRIS